MSSLDALEVMIEEATVSVANGYNEVLLQQACNQQLFLLVVLKTASCFLAHHEQGSSRYLCIWLYFWLLL